MNETERKTEHTPAPWSTLGTWPYQIIVAGDKCIVGRLGGDSLAADADLIAAAPDLLAALEAALPWLQALAVNPEATSADEALNPVMEAVAEQALAALARARGEQSEFVSECCFAPVLNEEHGGPEVCSRCHEHCGVQS